MVFLHLVSPHDEHHAAALLPERVGAHVEAAEDEVIDARDGEGVVGAGEAARRDRLGIRTAAELSHEGHGGQRLVVVFGGRLGASVVEHHGRDPDGVAGLAVQDILKWTFFIEIIYLTKHFFCYFLTKFLSCLRSLKTTLESFQVRSSCSCTAITSRTSSIPSTDSTFIAATAIERFSPLFGGGGTSLLYEASTLTISHWYSSATRTDFVQ